MYAGLDWSGWKKGRHRVQVAALAAVPDQATLAEMFQETRRAANLPANFEFHAHECGVDNIIRLLDRLEASMIPVRVALRGSFETLPEATMKANNHSMGNWHFAFGVDVIQMFTERYPLASLSCDHDIAGKKLQRQFITESKRAIRSDGVHQRTKITFEQSQQNECVQVADIIAYITNRMLRGDLDHPRLRRSINTICADQENIIIL